MTYPQTPRNTPTRYRERASYDRDAVHAVLDEALVCHVGWVADGEPRMLPNLHVRVDDTLYLHGSTGGSLARGTAGTGRRLCVTVTLLDGLVLAPSQFHHSVNYRSVVVHGVAHLVDDPQRRRRVLNALVDKVATGRAADTRPPTARELAQTAVLALPLVEVSLKTRSAGAASEPEDEGQPYWSGIIPVRTVRGTPQPAPDAYGPVPAYLTGT